MITDTNNFIHHFLYDREDSTDSNESSYYLSMLFKVLDDNERDILLRWPSKNTNEYCHGRPDAMVSLIADGELQIFFGFPECKPSNISTSALCEDTLKQTLSRHVRGPFVFQTEYTIDIPASNYFEFLLLSFISKIMILKVLMFLYFLNLS